VPRRVAALLGAAPAPGAGPLLHARTPRAIAAVLLACLALSAGCALEAASDLHGSIEVAQGE
jgi:hypothetical protein